MQIILWQIFLCPSWSDFSDACVTFLYRSSTTYPLGPLFLLTWPDFSSLEETQLATDGSQEKKVAAVTLKDKVEEEGSKEKEERKQDDAG